MRKFFIFFMLLLLSGELFSQETKEKIVQVLKSPDGFMYTNNTPDAYFTIDFKGDSIAASGVENGFTVDGNLFQVVLNKFAGEEYRHGQDSAKETGLLKKKMESELDYISKEVLKKELLSGFEVFKNREGKNYFLWHYIAPVMSRKNPDDILVSRHYFLTFVANRHVVGVAMPVFENEKPEDRKAVLKELADRIDVFGSKIEINGLYYKLESRADGKDLEYVDSVKGFSLTIKDWLNITESPVEDVFIGTLPDIDNIQNAIMVKSFKKTVPFKEFNETILPPGLKSSDKFGGGVFMLKKELAKPPKIDGLSYFIQVFRGGDLYNSHYTTLETSRNFLLVVFTATPSTYELNHPRFLEFLEGIERIK